MARKKLIASGVGVALVVGYGALDAFDQVPGVLTTAAPNEVRAVTVDGQRHKELKPANVASAQVPVGAQITPAQVQKVLDESRKDQAMCTTPGVVIRDAASGKVLAQHDSSRATTPASVTKLASAYAVTHSKLPLNTRLQTRALVQSDTLTLVAGGDMALAKEQGDATKVAGRAGLGDLADETAAALKKQGKTSVTLNSNTHYADGPSKPKGWGDDMLQWGFASRVSMLALADDRFDDKTPAVQDPTKNATQAFADALKKRGITAKYGKNTTEVPAGTQVGVVESATVSELLGLALQDSDNALTESLARQAAVRDGVKSDAASVGAWVVAQAKKQGINTAGMKLQDASGLSGGTTLPVRVLGDMITRATTGQDQQYARVVSQLPVASWNGTLKKRFWAKDAEAAQGIVRAKTGSLNEASSLAGTVVTKKNRKLVFAISCNGTFPNGPVAVKASIDRFVTKLSQVG